MSAQGGARGARCESFVDIQTAGGCWRNRAGRSGEGNEGCSEMELGVLGMVVSSYAGESRHELGFVAGGGGGGCGGWGGEGAGR